MELPQITAKRLDAAAISVSPSERTSLLAARIDAPSLAIGRVHGVAITASAIGGVSISARRVVDTETFPYIIIPQESVWLREENDFVGNIEVISNTNWHIE